MQPPARTLSIESIRWSAHQLVLRFVLGELLFSTTYWYPDVDLRGLEARFGRDLVERRFVHIALFELLSFPPPVKRSCSSAWRSRLAGALPSATGRLSQCGGAASGRSFS